MARYQVVLTVEGSRIDAVEKEARAAFKGEVLTIRKVDLSKSRGDRLNDIAGTVSEAASDVDELKGEMEEWLENVPESLQGGEKYGEVEECISQLEELKDSLENVDFSNVSFPGMF